MMKKPYDAIIVGAGVSGLVCGNFLAKRGTKVLICEQHITPGGYACGFERKGYYFDGGVQSFGSYGMVFPLLRELGLWDKMRFKPSRVRFVGPGLDLTVRDLEGIRDAFKERCPEAAEALDGFFAELSLLVAASKLFAQEPAIPMQNGFEKVRSIAGLMMNPESRTLMSKMGEWNRMKYPEFIRKHLGDYPGLCKFFTRLCYPDASLVAYAGMWGGYLHDYWYPENGMQGFADQLARGFTERGGEIRYRAKVERVLTDHRKVRGIRLESGEMIEASHLIWAGDGRLLLNSMDDVRALAPDMRRQYETTPLSSSFVSLFLGLDMPSTEADKVFKAHHVFYYPDLERDTPNDEAAYFKGTGIGIVSPGFENPALNKNGRTSLIVQAFAPYEWMNTWGAGPEGRTGEEYRRLKQSVGEDLMDSLSSFIPGIRERVEVMEVATPLTMKRYTLNSGGASAGWSWDPDQTPYKNNRIAIQTPVRNLLTCGHWTTTPAGIPAAALTGWMAAKQVR